MRAVEVSGRVRLLSEEVLKSIVDDLLFLSCLPVDSDGHGAPEDGDDFADAFVSVGCPGNSNRMIDCWIVEQFRNAISKLMPRLCFLCACC